MKKPIMYGLAMMMALSLALPLVSAHCPLCTGAAIGGVAAARFFGVDDSLVGLFLGAFIVSTALWADKMLKKRINLLFQQPLLILISFFLLAVPFYSSGLITDFEMVKSMPTHHGMTGLGIVGLAESGVDKILFGMILGTLAIWGSFSLSDYIKGKRGKVLWPYQGLSFMFITLAVLSLILWLITK